MAEEKLLRDLIQSQSGTYSKRLQEIANLAMERPTDFALERISYLADIIRAQPSAFVRFAKNFGYKGFSEFQAAFRAQYLGKPVSYRERIRRNNRNTAGDPPGQLEDLFAEVMHDNIASFERLAARFPLENLAEAVNILSRAKSVYIVAQRRSFPIATYLAYSLSRIERPVHLIDNVGGLSTMQHQAMKPEDVLVAVSFYPYAPVTSNIARSALEKNIPIVAISDSTESGVAKIARTVLKVHDPEMSGMRALTSSMAVAFALVMGIARQTQTEHSPLQFAE